MIISINIVAHKSTIAKTKDFTILLTDNDATAINEISRTITLGKLIGVSISLNGATELLGRNQVQILNVIGINSSRFSTTRTLGNSGQTVPSNALRILAGIIEKVKHTPVNTSFVKFLTSLVPNKLSSSFRHSYFPP